MKERQADQNYAKCDVLSAIEVRPCPQSLPTQITQVNKTGDSLISASHGCCASLISRMTAGSGSNSSVHPLRQRATRFLQTTSSGGPSREFHRRSRLTALPGWSASGIVIMILPCAIQRLVPR